MIAKAAKYAIISDTRAADLTITTMETKRYQIASKELYRECFSPSTKSKMSAKIRSLSILNKDSS